MSIAPQIDILLLLYYQQCTSQNCPTFIYSSIKISWSTMSAHKTLNEESSISSRMASTSPLTTPYDDCETVSSTKSINPLAPLTEAYDDCSSIISRIRIAVAETQPKRNIGIAIRWWHVGPESHLHHTNADEDERLMERLIPLGISLRQSHLNFHERLQELETKDSELCLAAGEYVARVRQEIALGKRFIDVLDILERLATTSSGGLGDIDEDIVVNEDENPLEEAWAALIGLITAQDNVRSVARGMGG
ncbi:hypothetical protein CC80DRAFT_494911 [Byssothecium circinans]|uniref:Uncharacterized protein n=1 Tax=Byssothecium circinans TaxID=147558 RepID=A0A6A5TQE3_9PLEO|nr:hypothetical protein CC80DRAFT_494911 [Byssothecium circinans]